MYPPNNCSCQHAPNGGHFSHNEIHPLHLSETQNMVKIYLPNQNTTTITEVNLSEFVYARFHDFSSLIRKKYHKINQINVLV